MADYTVKLPDVGEGVAEAEIVEWHVAVGDHIEEDDVMVDVMSDKATIELPSPVTGVVGWIAGDVGEVIAVGSPIVRIAVDAEAATETDIGPEARPAEARAAEARPAEVPTGDGDRAAPAEAPRPALPTRAAAPGGRPTAAPTVRARARALGVDLGTVRGTGPDGRITHGDLDALLRRPELAAAPAVPAAGADDVEAVKVIGLRRNIAERMQASTRRIPHFTYVEEIDVTDLEQLRHELNDGRGDDQPALSVLPFLMRAIVLAVRRHPEMNARFDDDQGIVRRHRAVHLGIAVQTERGLMVPVVQHAEALDLWASAGEVARLAAAARAAKITLDELSGSTITITSLGALGGIVSTPVINAPEVAIVGVNKIVARPVYRGDALVRRQIMNLSSSFDHRVIDGADAAAFIGDVRRLLETPALLFVDR